MSNFHIFGKSENIRELPFHIFQGNESIAVKKLIIEWESKETEPCVMITSTLIERVSKLVTKTRISEVEFYRVQQAYMHCATITIESMFCEQLPKFKMLFIKLIESKSKL